MTLRCYRVPGGEPVDFAHAVDAVEQERAGLVSYDPPGTPEEKKTVIQEPEFKGMEAAEDMSPPDVRMGEVAAPEPAPVKKAAPRRRKAAE